MGDIIEITRQVFHQALFYKVDGNGIWFDIKATNRAYIALTKDLKKVNVPDCWIEFCNPGSIVIWQEHNGRTSVSDLQFTLSQDNYTRFWIAWDNKLLWVGIGNKWDMSISRPGTNKFNYITYGNKDVFNPATFRFRAPPLPLSRVSRISDVPNITTGKLHWKQCENQLPDDAVIGGYIGGEIVYVVRARHRQSLTPGVFVPSKGLAFIPWGGSDNPTGNFEALCGFNLKWVIAPNHKIPVDAFVAGYSEVNREPLYIARALCQDNKVPGKLQLSHGTCYIAYQGKERAVDKYEVLTEPGLNVYCANTFINFKDPNRTDNPEMDSDNYSD